MFPEDFAGGMFPFDQLGFGICFLWFQISDHFYKKQGK
jgi:hypothetical protein